MPEKFVPVNIPNAVTEVNLNSWRDLATLYRELLPLLPQNEFRVVHEYNQKKDVSCVIFSAMGMITYNTGLQFTNEEGREMWQEYQGNNGGSIFRTTKQMTQRFMLDSFPVDVYEIDDFELVMNKGWGLQVSLWCGLDVFVDGVKDGVMDGEYTRIRDLDGDVMKHAIFMYRTADGQTWFQNTWPDGSPKNIYNCTKVYKQMIEKQLIRQCAMLAVPFSQEKYPGMSLTWKHYSKMMARKGFSTTAATLWDDYKKNYAHLDGIIDPQYKIR